MLGEERSYGPGLIRSPALYVWWHGRMSIAQRKMVAPVSSALKQRTLASSSNCYTVYIALKVQHVQIGSRSMLASTTSVGTWPVSTGLLSETYCLLIEGSQESKLGMARIHPFGMTFGLKTAFCLSCCQHSTATSLEDSPL
jgi:hypothetical protein